MRLEGSDEALAALAKAAEGQAAYIQTKGQTEKKRMAAAWAWQEAQATARKAILAVDPNANIAGLLDLAYKRKRT